MTTCALKASLGVITGTSALKASLRVINGKQNNELNGENSLVGIPLHSTSKTLHTYTAFTVPFRRVGTPITYVISRGINLCKIQQEQGVVCNLQGHDLSRS